MTSWQLPEELTAYAGLISTPDGTPAVGVMACYCGDLVEGERVLNPLRAFGSPIVDTVQPVPFPVMQKLADEANPKQHSQLFEIDVPERAKR